MEEIPMGITIQDMGVIIVGISNISITHILAVRVCKDILGVLHCKRNSASQLDILEDKHKVFEEMPTREVVGYVDKLNDICGDFVDTKNQWGDNICSIVEKVPERVNEQWSKDVESEEEYDSTDFSFPFTMNSRTERYVADGLLVTYDGKPKVNDMLNCIGNEDSVTTASVSEEKVKIVAALVEEECRFPFGSKIFTWTIHQKRLPSSISQEMLLMGYPLQKKIEFPMSSNNFSFSLVNYYGDLLLSEVDTISALDLAASTVIKRHEATHVLGSTKFSAIREYVQFSRRANFSASLPSTFADALTNIVDKVEVKEVLKEGVMIRFGKRALIGHIISWNFPLFMCALSIYYNTILNILGIGKSRLYISNFERLGQGGRNIGDNMQWWLTRDTVSLLAIFSTQLTTYLLDNLSASESNLYQPLDIIFSQGHSHNGCSLKEKKYSCLVDLEE
ncbi:hypothetical protein KY285_010284 [Solanum tuberosum]|nr:hypothetical protein KY289_010825 [Solanum tuberosum]KAH0734577.1 hypothetical protein KY285_010284 [Solanum tuberosum]